MGEIIFILVIAWVFTIRDQSRDAAHRFRSAYRQEQKTASGPTADTAVESQGAVPREFGHAVGAAARTVRRAINNITPGHGKTGRPGFWTGWGEGFNKTEMCRRRAEAWKVWARYYDIPQDKNPYVKEASPHPVPDGHQGPVPPAGWKPPVTPEPDTPREDTPIQPDVEPGGRVLSLVPKLTANRKKKDMTEIVTVGQLQERMRGIIEDAQAELEDAQMTLQREKELASDVEFINAQLVNLTIDHTVSSAVANLGDSAASVNIATQRVAACEKRIADATAVLTAIDQSPQASFYAG